MIGFSTFFSLFLLFFINFQSIHHKIGFLIDKKLIPFDTLAFPVPSSFITFFIITIPFAGRNVEISVRPEANEMVIKKKKEDGVEGQRQYIKFHSSYFLVKPPESSWATDIITNEI
jgi:hypothetical protein